MQIVLNIDNVKLTQKPTGGEYGKLSKRLRNPEKKRQVDAAELVGFVKQGRAFTPAALNGQQSEDWEQQQVICADIDNDTGKKDENGAKIPLPEVLTPERAREVMQNHNITPFFMYHTFSSKPDSFPKFRIILVLAEPIKDKEKAGELNKRFTAIFNNAVKGCADGSNKDLNRIYLPGQPGGIMYQEEGITSLETLEALPEIPEEPKPEPKPRPAAMYGEYEEENERFKRDVANFDMLGYCKLNCSGKITSMGGGKYRLNPCPVCEHKDCFTIYTYTNSFSCYSNEHAEKANNGKTGGDGITLIEQVEKLTNKEAIDKFKYDIMRYEKPERKPKPKKEPRKRREEAETMTEEQTAPQMQSAQDVKELQEVDSAQEVQKPQERGEAAADQREEAPKKTAEELAAEYREKWKRGAERRGNAFLQAITTEKYKPIPTGINSLDEALDGGFMKQWLVTLGAAPGAGKTTLAQWIFENMASAGNTVIFINLEMSREQLIASSLARIIKEEYNTKIPTVQILKGYEWNDMQREKITAALKLYTEKTAPFICYNPEPKKDPGAEAEALSPAEIHQIIATVQETAKQAKAAGLDAPILVIDYLQVLEADGKEDKAEIIKEAIKMLKRYAIEYNSIVFAITAQGREANKDGTSTLESGRDTSNIEYGADLVLGLDFTLCLPTEEEIIDKKTGKKVIDQATGKVKKQMVPGKKAAELTPQEKRKKTLVIHKSRFSEAPKKIELLFDGESKSFTDIYGHNPIEETGEELPEMFT